MYTKGHELLMPRLSMSLQTLPRWLWGRRRRKKKRKGRVICYWVGEIERRGNESEGSCPSVVSCVWKLIDVSQVGVIEDYFDSIQGVRLSYPLQLYLRTWTNGD